MKINYDSIDMREIAIRLGVQPQGGTYNPQQEPSTFHCFNKAAHPNGDRNPSLSIYFGGYQCGGCGVSGNREDLVMSILHCSPESAREWLISNFPFAVEGSNEPAPVKPVSVNKRSVQQVRKIDGTIPAQYRIKHYEIPPNYLREVNESDLANIAREIKKFYCVEAFQATKCQIVEGEFNLISKAGKAYKEQVYGIALPKRGASNTYITKSVKDTDLGVVVEGVTDYLTCTTLNLHQLAYVLARYSKTTHLKAPAGIKELIIIRDPDETVEQLKTRIDPETKVKCQISEVCLDSISTGSWGKIKDISDFWQFWIETRKTGSPTDYLMEFINLNKKSLSFSGESLSNEKKETKPKVDNNLSFCFWNDKYAINLTDMYREFEARGFCHIRDEFSCDQDKFQFVRIVDNVIHRKQREELPNYAMRQIIEKEFGSIDEHKARFLMSQLHSQSKIFFAPQKFDFLPFKSIHTNRDDENTFYLLVKNCVVKLSKEKKGNVLSKMDFKQLPLPVWQSSIIDREIDFDELKKTYDYYTSAENPYFQAETETTNDKQASVFGKFIKDTCRNPNNGLPDMDRVYSLCNVLGYLCHDRVAGDAPTVIFTESNLGSKTDGGTGKSIIIKALAEVKRICLIPCRDLKHGNDFKYDTYNNNDRLICFEDVNKSFNFQTLYNISTEGMIINKKQQRKVTLLQYLSPKAVVTANDAVASDEGWSTERRRFDMELMRYFSRNITPETKYGHKLLIDWDIIERSRFYAFMIYCVNIFFQNDNKLKSYESKTIKLRQLIMALSESSVEIISAFFADKALSQKTPIEGDKLPIQVVLYSQGRKELYDLIRTDLGKDKKILQDKYLKNLIDKFCLIKGIKVEYKRISNKEAMVCSAPYENFTSDYEEQPEQLTISPPKPIIPEDLPDFIPIDNPDDQPAF